MLLCSSPTDWHYCLNMLSIPLSPLSPSPLPQGAVITPAMDHTMSMQPANMMGPLSQQMTHLSLGTTGSVSTVPPMDPSILDLLELNHITLRMYRCTPHISYSRPIISL